MKVKFNTGNWRSAWSKADFEENARISFQITLYLEPVAGGVITSVRIEAEMCFHTENGKETLWNPHTFSTHFMRLCRYNTRKEKFHQLRWLASGLWRISQGIKANKKQKK